MNKMNEIILDNGKYGIVYDKNGFPLECHRYGTYWKSLAGDGLIFNLCSKIVELIKENSELKDTIVGLENDVNMLQNEVDTLEDNLAEYEYDR